MHLSKKIILASVVGFFANMTFAQSVQDGINLVDSHKYAKAKENFNNLIAKEPTAENYFYLGNAYLTQFEPNFDKAQENFNKGLTIDPKSFLNKIGLATIKLGKGDKSAVAEIQQIVKDSKEKDAEVLFRAGEALTLFEGNNAPDIAISFITKAIEKAQKAGVPANYYYVLGDAYRIKANGNSQLAGQALTAYENALPVAKNKASVYSRIGTLWMSAGQWQKAKESLDKAIATDPTYAPAYKALAGFNIKYQKNAEATQNLINYTKYADEDPDTQLEIAKLYFTNEDYTNAKITLDKIFDKVDDPIKYKLRAYIQYSEADYAGAQQNMDAFLSKADKSRVLPSDQGLQGLIAVGQIYTSQKTMQDGFAKTKEDLAKIPDEATKKSELEKLTKQETDAEKSMKEAIANVEAAAQLQIAVAKNAKDETMKWDEELAKIKGGINEASVDQGPTSPEIENLRKKVAANGQDTDALYNLARAYQDVKNWDGAILTWSKMSSLLPDWAPAYYSQANVYQQMGNNEMAKSSYEKYISLVKPEEIEANKQSLGYAYYFVAYAEKDTNLEKAKQDIAKSLEYAPTYEDAVNLQKLLSK